MPSSKNSLVSMISQKKYRSLCSLVLDVRDSPRRLFNLQTDTVPSK